MKILQSLFQSKKMVALIVGLLLKLLAPLFRKWGYELTVEDVDWAIALIGSYIIGQGIADMGKEKSKVEAIVAGQAIPPPPP